MTGAPGRFKRRLAVRDETRQDAFPQGGASRLTLASIGAMLASMIRMIRPLALLLLLGACAATPPQEEVRALPTPEDCTAADWYEGGEEDARAGLRASEGLAFLAACPWPDRAAQEQAEDVYLAGHARGTAAYCAPANARELGRRRVTPALACPAPLAEEFRAAYARGLEDPAEEDPDSVWRPRVVPSLSVGIGTRGSGVSWGLGVLF